MRPIEPTRPNPGKPESEKGWWYWWLLPAFLVGLCIVLVVTA